MTVQLGAITASPGRDAHDGAARVAEQARRVLEFEQVILTRAGECPIRQRLVASVGGPALNERTWELLDENEQRLVAGERPRSDVRARASKRSPPWRAVCIGAQTRRTGTLHFLPPAGWCSDGRTRRMLEVFADRLREELGPAKPAVASIPEDDLVRIARVMTELGLTATTYEELVGGVTAAIAPLLDASKAGIGLWHRDGQYLQLLPGSFGADAAMAASSQIRGSDSRSGAARVRSTGRPYFTNDVQQDMPRYGVWLGHLGVRRLMSLPIPAAGIVGGVLHIANKRTDFVTDDIQKAARVLPFVAGALEHVRHRLEARHAEALAEVVGRAATGVAQGEPLTHFRDTALDEFCKTVGARMLAISFADGSSPILVRNGAGDSHDEAVFLRESSQHRGALRVSNRRPRAVLDGGRTVMHAPVMIAARHEATFSVLRVPCEPFSRDDALAVRRMASTAALAWATERIQHERLESARMRERQLIADDLHDHVAQVLFIGQLSVQSVIEELEADADLRPTLVRARDQLVRSQRSIREVIGHLSSPTPEDLAVGFTTIAESIDEEFGLPVDLWVAPAVANAAGRIPRELGDVVVRAAREAVVNAAKHGDGGHISMKVRMSSDRLLVSVEDSGPGMPERPRAEGYGLRAMRRNLREHGGSLRIGRSRLGGAKSLISIPLARPKQTLTDPDALTTP